MQNIPDPSPLMKTKPIAGQECFLFSYVLFRDPKPEEPFGLFKLVVARPNPADLKNDFKTALPTNAQAILRWGITGEWEVLRRPEFDTEGTVDIVGGPEDMKDTDDEFMGEKIPKLTRSVEADPKKREEIEDKGSVQIWKDQAKQRLADEKRVRLRKMAMEELQQECDDPTTLSSYAALQFKRLTQKSAIAEVMEKLNEGQKELKKTLEELRARTGRYPHYKDQWQAKIRSMHTMMAPKQAGNNPVDKPVSNLGTEDDDALTTVRPPNIKDPYDTGTGIDLKLTRVQEGKTSHESDDAPVATASKKEVSSQEEFAEAKAELAAANNRLAKAQAEEEEARVKLGSANGDTGSINAYKKPGSKK